MAPNPINTDFDAVVEQAISDWHVPGLSLSVSQDGQSWSRGYGLAHRSPETKVEATTLFYAASTTKAQLCAVWGIYILSEANKAKPADERISWSTPLANLVRDDFVLEDPIRTLQVTLEDCLSHRTGMPRHDLCYGKEGPSTPKAVTRHLRHLPLQHELRTKSEYCNVMYIAASHALETVTGKHLSQILREWLWQPLGMTQTYLGYPEASKAMEEQGEVLAKSYYWTKLPGSKDYEEGEYKEQPYMDFPEVSGAGEVISTADDYAKWMRCLITGSSPLSEEMTKELWTARSIVTVEMDMNVPFDGGLLNYGLGWFISSYRGYKCFWHPGGIIGAGSLVMVVPELKWGCSLFGNGNDVGMTLRGLPFVLLDKLLDLPGDQPDSFQKVEDAVRKQCSKIDTAYEEGRKNIYPNAPPKPQVPLALPIEDYAGTYRSKAYGRLTFSLEHGDDGTKRLTFLIDNKTWESRLTLEHVNAEFWMGTKALGVIPTRQAFRAESRVGVDGRVEWFGLVMEDGMPEGLVWFRRDGGD